MHIPLTEIHTKISGFGKNLKGDLFLDEASLLMYATDASAYREKPLAVVRPKNKEDIQRLIQFAREENLSLIPRAAGTSLAGQVVGNGIIVDIGKYLNRVLEINAEERWVRVEPGVVLDELNKLLQPRGLFFAPETSTSNRCMIGGMVGNNSCGAHSLLYGSTRDHTLEIKGYLSDTVLGSEEVLFSTMDKTLFEEKCRIPGLEGDVYRNISEILVNKANQEEIRREYPHPELERRNTGYALDLLLETAVFTDDRPDFNFCRLISGSEGTLMFMTEIKLNLVPLPPRESGLLAVHCSTLEEAFEGNLVALEHAPASIELIDRILIECTLDNIEQNKNRFFIEGTPEAILVVEFFDDSADQIRIRAAKLEAAMREAGYGYHFPLIMGPDISKVWALRKAGLGLLSNVPGDAKPVTMIEDTAVRPVDLPAYMREFREILKNHGKECVYYAHIATGELHLKPVLDLKDPEDVKLFRTISTEIAHLVKKYRGSLSGEHGDGRLRGEFIPLMIGDHNYELCKEIKKCWDPRGIFNPGKITDTPPMDAYLRYKPGTKVREIETYFDFSKTHGILRAVEKCNGSGDCRKTEVIGGTMCPSYMATRDENATTRARANILREFLSNSPKSNPFDHIEIKQILDLCLSCKACKSECPSNVDMAKFKAEFLQHYYDANGAPLRAKLIAGISRINRIGSIVPGLFNFLVNDAPGSAWVRSLIGFSPKRTVPRLYKTRLSAWVKNHQAVPNPKLGTVYFFADEFTEFNDTAIGIRAIELLTGLGYHVIIPDHLDSGRTWLSKGFLKKARKLAVRNVEMLKDLISAETPLVGLEPSAILSFRDEYPELVPASMAEDARILGRNALMIDEFLASEFAKGRFGRELFSREPLNIKLHGHCQQKSIASTTPTKKMLEIPEHYKVEEIKSGCCGMAGSFGFEKEHYEVSMKVGELVLFPAVRAAVPTVVISAPGTSCRHQIHDGTGKSARHPVEILADALL